MFADIGLPNPVQELLKAKLTLQIYAILKDSSMTQVEIAKILGVRQPQVSLLMRNRAGNFSVGRLMEFLRFCVKTGNHRAAQQQGTWRTLSGLPANVFEIKLEARGPKDAHRLLSFRGPFSLPLSI